MRFANSKENMSTPEIQTQVPEVVDQAEVTHEKTPKESFAELRKAKEDLEKEKWKAEQELKMYKEQMQAQQMQKVQAPDEEEFDYRQLEQEEFPDGKKLVKALNTFSKKLNGYEKQLAERDQKIQILETATEFPDFKEIVTAENIEKYIKSDEDLSEAVQTAKNPLRKVYNLIKKSAAYQSDMAAKQQKSKPVSQEQQRVDEKESKPKIGSHGVRSEAISTAAATSNSKMSRQQKESLWRETMAASRK